MNKKILLSTCIAIMLLKTGYAQQFKWAKNGSAKALLSSATSISVNSANETWAVAYTGSSTRFKGAGNGVAPDIGVQDVTGSKLVKYDANMNLVWIAPSPGAPLPGAAIAADPNNSSVFYLAFQLVLTTIGQTYSGLSVTGQAASYTVVLAKCTISGSSGITYNWVRKIDGSSDESIDAVKVKDIGGGNLRIAILGNSRSPTLTNYTDGTTGVGQTLTTNNISTGYYDHFVSCYDGNGTPLWINDFGIANYSEYGYQPFDMNDKGDVLYCQNYTNTGLGTTSFILNNNTGGTTNTTSYSANVNSNNRMIFFNFDGSTGAVNWAYNQLANTTMTLGGMGIATDAALNVYLQGYVSGKATIPSTPAIGSITPAGGYDLCVLVFDNTGNPIRAQRYGSTGNEATTINFNNFALDRTNNLMYMASTAPVSFTNNTATVQVLSGNTADAFILCAGSTGAMNAVNAVTLNGSVTGSTQHFGAIALQNTGDIVALGDYVTSGQNRVNANTTPLFPKTAYGYQDVAITRFTTTTLTPVAEGTWGGLTSNTISAVALTPDGTLVSAGTFGGALTVGSTTINSTAGVTSLFMAVTDTATGNINAVYAATGSTNTCDMKISPQDGSIYLLFNDYNNTSFNGGPTIGIVQGGSDVYLVKLNSSYVRQWTVEIGGGENDNAGSLAIDPVTGDVFISGTFNSPTLKWISNSNVVSAVIATNGNTGLPTSGDVFVAKFNAAGSFQWITSGGNPNTALNDLTTKGLSLYNGQLYFGGGAANGTQTFSFGGASYVTPSTTTNGNYDLFLTQLDPSTGNAGWIKSWGGNGATDAITSIAPYNNLLYMGGYSNSTNMALGTAGTFGTTGNFDGFVFSANSAGTIQSGLMKIGGTNVDVLNQIAIDAAGNLFYAGYTASSPITIGGNAYATTGFNDWLVGCIDATTFSSKFAFVSGSVNSESLSGVVPGKLGMIFVGGNLYGIGTFGTYTLTGHTSGDYAYARIDYPYIAPGAVASNLNAWYKANALLTGNPATAWTNSTINSSLTTLTNTGTVAVTAAGCNFNPSVSTTGGTNYLSQSSIYASNFTDATANRFSVYTVYKPAATVSAVGLWSEPTTNTALSLSAAGTTITGTGGAKTAANTTALSTALYALSSAIINGTSATNYLNGTANGTVSGVTPLNITNSGNFTISGTGSSQVAEVITYGTVHTAGQPNMNRIDTYLGLKYGITLAHHYYSSIGDTVFNADGTGTTFIYDNNIAGIGRDDNEVLDQRQSQSQNTALKGNMLAIAQGSLAADNISNTNAFTVNNSYLVWGDDAVDMTTTAEQTINLPALAQYSACPVAVKRLRRSWKFKNKGHNITGSQLQYNLASLTISGSTTADFALIIDNDANGNFSNGSFTLIPASSYNNTTKILVFNSIDLPDSGVMTVITKQYTVLQATINGNPDSATICAGSNVALTVLNGPGSNPSYSWTSTNGYTSSQQSPAITGAGVTYAGNYMATAAGGTCTANTVKLIVNALPSVSLNAGPAVVCLTPQGQVNLTAIPGAGSGTYKSYAWTGPGITTATTTVTGNTARPTTSGTYTVTVTDSTGCKSTIASAPVTVDAPTPVIGVQCFSNPNNTTSAYLVEMGSQTYPGWTWLWTSSTSGLFYTTRNTTRGTGTATSTSQGVYINTTGTFNVTITDSNHCTATMPQVIYSNSCTTLAVNLLDFAAGKKESTALLNWHTATEINNSHFEIERSIDGNVWVTIGTVPGHSTSNADQQYVYTDEMPVNGINYYRLKQVDANGTFSYSEIKTLSFAGTWAVILYPNPVITGKVYVQSNEALTSIRMVNINGQAITTNRLPVLTVQSGTIYPVNVGNLLPGVYLVQVINNKGYARNLKLVKTN